MSRELEEVRNPQNRNVLLNLTACIQGQEAGPSTGRRRTQVLVVDPITNLFKDMLMNTSAQGKSPCSIRKLGELEVPECHRSRGDDHSHGRDR